VLCLYGLGTNAGLKRVSAGTDAASYAELLHVRHRFIHKEALRSATALVTNAILAMRDRRIWGEAGTACASDSTKISAWDQNLMTEWHVRYQGRGVMIYWHMERQATCIYSQLKRCSSSEVSAMIEGVLRHCTDMDIQRHYVDSHGQSVTWTVKPGVPWMALAGSVCASARFSVRLRAVSPPRPATFRGAARSPGQGWPQATAGGGAQRPWRGRALRHACRRRGRRCDHACMPMSASSFSIRAAVQRCRSTSRGQPRLSASSASDSSSACRSRRRGA